MKLTKKHRSNSQIHSVPSPDYPPHEVIPDCHCSPDLHMNNGHLIVEHRVQKKKGRVSWSAKTKNFGVKNFKKEGGT